MPTCPSCAAPLDIGAPFCPRCGAAVSGGGPPAAPPPSGDDGVATVIPYRNPPALIAYYLGLFSLVPCLGVVLSVPAVILGIVGLRRLRRQPLVKGVVHAWIGIGLGGLSLAAHAVFFFLLANDAF